MNKFYLKKKPSYFYDFIKLAAKRLSVLEERQPVLTEFDNNNFGTFEDTQAIGDYSKYGDLAFDTLLAKKIAFNGNYDIALELVPTYSYHRLYTTGTELKRHKDRPSCEISTTLCLL